jgi:hypothetical protein
MPLDFEWGCGNNVVMRWKLDNQQGTQANGVCCSKSYLWAKRCLTAGSPPQTREQYDKELFGQGSLKPLQFLAALNNGVGIGQTSIATQCLHAWGQRAFAKDQSDDRVDNFNKAIAKGHGLIVDGPLFSMPDYVKGTSHLAWLQRALEDGDGVYVFTVLAEGRYHHTMAMKIADRSALFDPETGQFSCPRGEFRDSVLVYMNQSYPRLEACDLWKPRLG